MTADPSAAVRMYRALEAGMLEAAVPCDFESIRWWLSAREARERMQRRTHPQLSGAAE